MKDNRYYDLREITEIIFSMRQYLNRIDKTSKDFEELSKIYNDLCKRREQMEEEFFAE